jgi:5-formyltetrahydrofolate cyclo-ligase
MTQTERSDKQAYREIILRRLPSLDWATVSHQICQQLIVYFRDSPLGVIAGYSPYQFEADIRPFLHSWQHQGGICCLPVVTEIDKPLIFRRWDINKPLVKGKYGILVPDETQEEVIPDSILTPLIGFDKHGTRLGRGGGYYDRTIAFLRKIKPYCQIIGMATEQQYVETLPHEFHDEQLDSVITESHIFCFSKLG